MDHRRAGADAVSAALCPGTFPLYHRIQLSRPEVDRRYRRYRRYRGYRGSSAECRPSWHRARCPASPGDPLSLPLSTLGDQPIPPTPRGGDRPKLHQGVFQVRASRRALRGRGKRAGPALPSVAWACRPTSTSGALAGHTFPLTPARPNLKTRPQTFAAGRISSAFPPAPSLRFLLRLRRFFRHLRVIRGQKCFVGGLGCGFSAP